MIVMIRIIITIVIIIIIGITINKCSEKDRWERNIYSFRKSL